MTSFSFTELIGYIASMVVVSSFLMKNIKKLRIINIIGCSLFICYGILLNFSVPIIFTNAAIVSINIYHIVKTA